MLVYQFDIGKLKILNLLFFLCFLLCKEHNCWGQNQTDTLKIIHISDKNVFLENNSLKVLPLVFIKQQQIGNINTFHHKVPHFIDALEKYSSIEKFNFSKWDDVNLMHWLKSKETIILALNREVINSDNFILFFKNIKTNYPKLLEKIVAVFFDEDIQTKYSTDIIFPTSIYVKINDINAYSITAQSIFGALPFYNQKGEKVTQGNLRLGYTSPEMVNMNQTLLNEKIDSIVTTSIVKGAFPGAQILIAKNQKVIFHKVYGHHTFNKTRKVQHTDIYDFASVSKITTALPALMKLHGDGKFQLDAPFKTYFPKFKKSNKANLSYREILAHQAGLRPWIPYWKNTIKKNGKFKRKTFKKKPSRRYNVKITDQLYLHKKYKKKIYKAICKSKVSEEKKYKYSGLAFYLFPEMVSHLTQTEYETYLESTFYEPLGAMTLTYNPLRYFPQDRIIPTERDTFFRKQQIHGTVHDEGAIMMGGVSANAGLFGSANDLAKLMQMYLNGGTYGGKRFIAKESIEEFTKYQYPENENRRGLGFDKPLLEYDAAKSSVAKDASPSSYGHSGYTGTFVWVDPEHELIYIFFSNRVFPTRDNRKIYELNIRPSIHQVIYDAIKSGN